MEALRRIVDIILPKQSAYQNLLLRQFFGHVLVVVIMYILLKIGIAPALDRSLNIVLPILLFIRNEWMILQQKNELFTKENQTLFRWCTLEESRYYVPLINYLSILPMLPVFAFMAMADMGFLFIFIIAFLIYKLVSNVLKSGMKVRALRWKYIGKIIVGVVSLLLLLLFPGYLIAYLFQWAFTHYIFFYLFFFVLIGSAILVMWYDVHPTFSFGSSQRSKEARKRAFSFLHYKHMRLYEGLIYVGLGTLVVLAIKPLVISVLNDKLHIRYRAEVNIRDNLDLNELSLTTANYDGNKQFNELSEQALNKWFIESFIRNTDDVNPSKAAFHKKPHFSTGSDYVVQTRDTILPRYIIGEHHWSIPFLLCFLLLAILVFNIIYFNHSSYSSYGKITSAILILIFGSMLFVTLTATNLIPFFGQDFPFFSTTSLHSILLPLVLFTTYFYLQYLNADRQVERTAVRAKTGGLLVLLVLLVLFPLVLFLIKKEMNKEYGILNMEEVLAEVESYNHNIKNLYQLLENYQTEEITAEDAQYLEEVYGASIPTGYASASTQRTLHTLERKLSSDFTYFDSIYSKSCAFDVGSFQPIHPEEFFESPFTKQAYQQFKQARSKTDPRNIFYLTNYNGRFALGVNRDFEKVRLPENKIAKWKGDIYWNSLATHHLWLATGNTLPLDTLKLSTRKDTLFQLGSMRCLYVPASVSGNGKGYLVVGKRRSTKRSLHADTQPKGKTNFTCLYQGQDLYLSSGQSDSSEFRLRYLDAQSGNYVMHNFTVNNQPYFYYPLKNQFIWAYNFTNYVQQAQRSVHQLQPDTSYRTTLDFQLTQNLQQLLQQKQNQGSAIVVLLGNGQILSIADKNNHALNPNNRKALQEYRQQTILRSNSSSGRKEFGNYALLHMNNGPGSSQKPITYAAVASQLKLDWNSLRYFGVPIDSTIVVDDIAIEFAGNKLTSRKNFKQGFKLKPHDKMAAVDYDTYLASSVNMYHGMVCYLGSYNPKTFGMQVFQREQSMRTFPKLSYAGVYRSFNEKYTPDFKSIQANRESFLAQGYYKNFGNQYQTDVEARFNLVKQPFLGYGGYAYPEVSILKQHDRTVALDAIKFTTLGAGKVWSVTPLGMAVMGARLFTLNAGFEATYLPQIKPDTPTSFTLGRDSVFGWKNDTDYVRFVQSNIFLPMQHVLQAPHGTAKIYNALKAAYPNYHFYAKTGTIDAGGKVKDRDDKLFLLAISEGPLHELKTLNDIRKNKVVILYFSLPFGETTAVEAFYQEVVQQVMASGSVQNYFRQYGK